MTGCNMVPNPFREAFLAMLDVTAGVSDSLTFGRLAKLRLAFTHAFIVLTCSFDSPNSEVSQTRV